MRQAFPQDVKIVATTISQRVPLGYSAHTFHEKPPCFRHGGRINGALRNTYNRLIWYSGIVREYTAADATLLFR